MKSPTAKQPLPVLLISMLNLAMMLMLMLMPKTAFAHKPSDAFLTLKVDGTTISGQYDIAIKDLNFLLGVDRNEDLKVTWGELQGLQSEIFQYAVEHVHIKSNNAPCQLKPIDLQVSRYSDGAYGAVRFETSCADKPLTALEVQYDSLFDFDAQHRGLLSLSYRQTIKTYVFSDQNRTFAFDPLAVGTSRQFVLFIKDGMNHIFEGYDHMLFLLALVLPAVYVCRRRKFEPQEQFRPVFFATVKVVTAFTAAHTLSLCLTTFSIVSPPPSRIVESLVAFTVLVTALNNLYPIVAGRLWYAGFGFGLVHGMAFASALTDLGLKGWDLAVPLVGFNVGVELAQTLIVGCFLPCAYLLRRTRFYHWTFLVGGSIVTASLALVWMLEQILQKSILGF